MRTSVYYNEIDPFAAEWMRWLIKAGGIPDGVIDTRSIVDVQPEDIRDFDQCHFFAGIGGWPLALGRAGWPSGRRVWSGSCPCPPFSVAGRKKACPKCSGIRPIPCPRRTGVFVCIDCDHAWYADGRHLYPEFHRLISECRPPVVYLEQVAGGDGLIWLAGVRARLERSGYALGAADLPAACVGSPNIRQRLWGCAVRVADSELQRTRSGDGQERATGFRRDRSAIDGAARGMADSDGGISGDGGLQRGGEQRLQPEGDGVGRLEHADSPGRGEQRGAESVRSEQSSAERTGGARGLDHASIDGHRKGADPGEQSAAGRRHGGDGGSGSSCEVDWSDFDLVYCGDDKWRRIPSGIEPGIQRLAYGLPVDLDLLRAACQTFPRTPKVKGRVGVLRGFGNAINPAVAAKFIRLTMRWLNGERR